MTNEIKLGRSPTVKIKVTKELIANAIERNSSHCVVADAVRAHFESIGRRECKFVAVDIQTIRFSDQSKKERYTYFTPRKCQVAIIQFDQGKTPKPFAFELRDGQTSVAGHSAIYHQKRRERDAKRALEDKLDEKKHISSIKTKPTRTNAKFVKPKDGSEQSVPLKVGGRAPPSGSIRRAFGLRGFER